MIKRILFLLLVTLTQTVFASAPQSGLSLGLLSGQYFADPAAMCQAANAAVNAAQSDRTYTCTGANTSDTAGYKYCYRSDPNNCGSGRWNGSFELYCPATGKAPDTSKPLAQQCPDAPPPSDECKDHNPIIRKFYYTAGATSVPPNHFGFCEVVPEEMLVCRTDSTGTYCMWRVHRNGNKWDGDTTSGSGGTVPSDENDGRAKENDKDPKVKSPPITNKPADPKICPTCVPCPSGTVQAGVDSSGIPVCMGTGSNPPDAPKKPDTTTSAPTTQTNSDGSTTTKQQTQQQNSDGSVTTTTTTTIKGTDGSVTVKQDSATSATPSGAKGATDSSDEKSDFCKQNPMLSICRNSSVSGTCGTISCDGDAIQCATLRAAAAMQCQQQKDLDEMKDSSLASTGKNIIDGADPMKSDIDKMIKGTDVDLSKPQLDQSGFLGGGSCLSNKTFSVLGKSVTVEFGELCKNIQPLRGVVMACAFILAYLIVSRSVLQS